MALEALIFDVDGTLAETERHAHRVAFNEAFAAAGLDWVWDEELYGELLAVSGGRERMAHYVGRHRPDAACPGLPDLIARLHRDKTARYERLVAEGRVPLRPGIVRLLREARAANIRLGIATTTSRRNVEALIVHVLPPDLADAFEAIGTAEDAPVKKPAPGVYHGVLDRMALAPHRALAVEDTENGLRAARAAGLATLVTLNDYSRGQTFDGALAVVTCLGDETEPARILLSPDGEGDAIRVDIPMLRRWFEVGA